MTRPTQEQLAEWRRLAEDARSWWTSVGTRPESQRAMTIALLDEVARLRAERDEAAALVGDFEELVYESGRWLNDSTLWESDKDLAPRWQQFWNKRGEMIARWRDA